LGEERKGLELELPVISEIHGVRIPDWGGVKVGHGEAEGEDGSRADLRHPTREMYVFEKLAGPGLA